MKKLKILCIVLICFSFLLFITTSCSTEKHEHTWSNVWDFDDSWHWHNSTCEHKDEKSDDEEHEFGEYISSLEEGNHRICKVCGYKEIVCLHEKIEYALLFEEDHMICCLKCGSNWRREHVFGDWKTTKEPTETSTGTKERTCSVCKYKEKDIIPATQHSHSYSSTYKSNSTKHWKECSCGEKIDEQNHSFGDWKTIKEPTETITGTKERTCSVCKYKETDTIPTTIHTHTYGSWKIVKEPTLATEGKISRVCKENNQHIEEFTLPKLDEKNYTLNVSKKATCTTDGEGVYVYSKDNQKFEFSTIIQKLGHQYEITSTTATCTTAGSTTYVCKNDASHTYSETGKALGHDYIKHETKKATCLESGLNTYVCSRDSSHTYTEVVLAEHNYQEGYCSECNKKCDFDYEILTDTTCKITKYTGVTGNSWGNGVEISIPSYIDGYQVVELEEGLLNGCFTSKLILPFAGLNLNPNTFEERFIGSLFGTTPVSLITPVRVIGTDLSITNYYLPNVHLKEVVVRYGDIPDDWLNCSDKLNINKLTISSNTKRIGNNAFLGINLLDFVMPETIEEIGDNAFSGLFSKLIGGKSPDVSFNFPASLKKIGNSAFSGNTFLKEISFEKGLESIGHSAFSGCISLSQELIIPESVIRIGDGAFYQTGIIGIEIKGITSLGKRIFKESSLKNFKAKGITNIGQEAFSHCNLETFTVETLSGVIEESAFAYCSKLENLELSEGLTEIQTHAFQECNLLTKIIVPNSVEKIGADAFYGCINLTEITLPFVGGSKRASTASKETLFGYIFHSVNRGSDVVAVRQKYNETQQIIYYLPKNLTKVTITGGNILYGAFSNCSNISNIIISSNITNIGSDAFSGCSKLSNVYYEGTVEDWCNITFSNEYSNPMSYASHFYIRNSNNEWKEVTSIEIPNSISQINKYQFYGFNNLTVINVSNHVNSIGESAFSNCSNLTSITLLNIETSISNNAFNNCTKLSKVYYGGTIEDWLNSQFTGSTFFTFSNSNHFYLKNSNNEWEEVTSIEIPNTITEIGNSQFYGFNNVTSVIMPNCITSIGENAFSGCNNLTNLEVPKSVISIGKSAFSSCNLLETIILPFVGASLNETIDTHFGYIFGASSANENSMYVPSSLIDVTITKCSSIGNNAFSGCENLINIYLADNITSIGEGAFTNCSKLNFYEYDYGFYLGNEDNQYLYLVKARNNNITNCHIHGNVKIICSDAFTNCSKLNTVFYEGNMEKWLNSQFTSKIFFKKNSTNHFYLKNDNDVLEEVVNIVIPDGTESIQENKFFGINNTTSLIVPTSVKSIGLGAFEGCDKLQTTTLPFVGGRPATNFGYIFGANSYSNNSSYVPNSLKEVVITSGDNVGTYAFNNCSSLTNIVIPESVISIGDSAFSGCSNLSSLTLPFVGKSSNALYASRETLFGYIFGSKNYNGAKATSQLYNTSTVTYYIPTSLKNITILGGKVHDNSFYSCGDIQNVTLEENIDFIGERAFLGCSSLKKVIIKGSVTDLNYHTFFSCRELTTIELPKSIEKISYDAFENCSSLANTYYMGTIEDWCKLKCSIFQYSTSASNHFYIRNDNEWEEVTSIEIPNTITEIGDYQFYGFDNVTSITIPDSVTSIGDYAFNGCSSLTSITIPDSVTSIGQSAFYKCSSLTKATLPALAIPSISKGKLEEVVITSGESIGDYAFNGCSSLTSITIPDSVTSIGQSAFYKCSSLTNVYYEGTIVDWCNITFSDDISNPMYYANHFYIRNGESVWEEVTSIEIPNGVTEIGYQFLGFNNVTSITIPNSVTSIGQSAFYKCSSLTNVYYEGTIVDWCNITFSDDISNPMYYANHFYIRNGESVWEEVTSIEIPNGVTEIGYQFLGFNNVTSITIPNSVTSIGQSAFSGCSIEKATLPTTAIPYIPKTNLKEVVITGGTSIGYQAFSGCSSLTSIIIPDSVTSIGSGAFYKCSSLTSITLPFVGASLNGTSSTYFSYIFGASSIYYLGYVPSSLKEVIITGGERIGSSAFYNCSSLKSIIIPDSVTSIGDSAFEDCSNLTSVYYEGTIEDWCNITFSNEYSTPMRYASHFYIRNSNNEWEEVTSIEIPNGVTEIGKYQFWKFSNVTSITIPNSVTIIGYQAFYSCSSLASITIPLVGETLNGTTNSHFGYIFGASSYSDNSKYVPSSLEEVILTGGESIGSYAFYGCSSLTSVTIGDSVTSIGENAFSSCSSLTSVTIGDSVTSIGENAFSSCNRLTSITIPLVGETLNGTTNSHFGYIFGASSYSDNSKYVPSSLEEVILTGGESIGSYAFYGCSSLTSVTIGDSVTSIGENAFSSCNRLTSITIPDSVTSIGNNVFYGCSKFTNVYYEGSIEDWCNITFSNSSSNPMRYASHFYIRNSNNEWEEVTSIEIPNTITKIGNYQFYGFSNVTSVTIPDSVTSIGSSAFENCSNLTSIEIPNSVTSIGNNVFYGCISLISIEIPNSVTSIENGAFRGCSSLTSVTIGNGVTNIGSLAFSDCYKLVEIYNYSPLKIDKGSTNFGYVGYYAKVIHTQKEESALIGKDNYVFIKDNVNKYYLVGYTGSDNNLVLPDDIEGNTYEINQYAFYNCSSLTSITIPNSVTSIGDDAFYGCSNLQYNEYNNALYIGNEENPYLYLIKAKDKSITSCTINEKTKFIFADAFSSCDSLTSIEIPNSVTSIGNGAFSGCSITNIYYNGTIENWCNITFSNSQSNPMYYRSGFYIRNSNNEWEEVTSIEIPNGVTEIGKYQFWEFSNVTSITIPNSVTSIGDSAFYRCSSLTSITIPNSVTNIGYQAFAYCDSLTSIVIPDSVTNIGNSAFWYCDRLTSIEIPNSVTSIGNSAFYYCSSLTSIVIPDSVTSIGENAFASCNRLTSITIPDSVTSIGKKAFYSCNSLASITIPFVGASLNGTSNTYFGYIFGASSYSDNSSYVPRSLKEVIITGGESIDKFAFYGCSSLTSVVIPNSVTSIGEKAFYGCSSLTSVYYEGTSADWNKIEIGSYNTLTTRYYYSETKPTEAGNYWHYVNGVPTKW